MEERTMALLGFGKKKEEVKETACCCGTPEPEAKAEPACACNGNAPAFVASEGCCCGDGKCVIKSIKVLGPGCKSCHELNEASIAAVKELEMDLEVEYITDMEKIMSYGVMSMPALVINEKVVSMGKALKTADIIKLLKKLGYC
jgi:small redox-active disulfide protein 2